MGERANYISEIENGVPLFGCSFEQALASQPPWVWVGTDGAVYAISQMSRRHVRRTVAMISRWVAKGRGKSEAAIVGAKRWALLSQRADEHRYAMVLGTELAISLVLWLGLIIGSNAKRLAHGFCRIEMLALRSLEQERR